MRINVQQEAKEFIPVGHNYAWYTHHLLLRQAVGIIISSKKKENILLQCKKPYLAGKREFPPLKIINWEFPSEIQTFKVMESSFVLSREYFNPFNPDEIKVDFEVEYPDKTIARWPAFFNLHFFRQKQLNREQIMPEGVPFWTFRFCPQIAGKYRLRLIIEDNSESLLKRNDSSTQTVRPPACVLRAAKSAASTTFNKPKIKGSELKGTNENKNNIEKKIISEKNIIGELKKHKQTKRIQKIILSNSSDIGSKKTEQNFVEKGIKIETPWREFIVKKGDNPGKVVRSKKPATYFCFSNGKLFYPIGFNIHSIVDLRAQRQLRLKKTINLGTFTYDEFFQKMSENGINAVELWMSAWCTAIEWTSRDHYYYGVGRYNLANAWKLDYLVQLAAQKGIYVHLVLDNHGKLAVHCDPEWYDSPYNKNRKFSIADGGFLSEPREYFTDEKAIKYNQQRYRYIAARWGAYPNIFGLGVWSEVDLVKGARTA
ncbi:MAG: hypothetical protein D6707_11675, partial [Bacteroidetes bacterium]